MPAYVFASSEKSAMLAATSIDALMGASPEFFAVVLAGDDELELLLGLLGIRLPSPVLLSPAADFSAIFDYSADLLPIFTPEEFDVFYSEWLSLSKRESAMDEYGQLIFLQGHGKCWNSKASRFILREYA
ncbi:hypothetical protein [Janthinobacterium sp. J1-1]|uniref:hypothetical protein n=1 Tax=Janthinobacterium sp. J1-1 TaxID=3065910 RepID=UPI002810D60E|nr:hypothetical protein [Janthinobacterium sp. J1-1]